MGGKGKNNFAKPVYRKAKKETEAAKKPAVVTEAKAKEKAQSISFVSDKMKNIENGVAVTVKTIDELFGHISSPVQLIVEDLHLAGYEAIKEDLEYLEQRYPEYIRKEDVLQEFTSLRYQTAINRETGTAKDGSLRNIRVVDAGTEFDGVWELRNAGQEHLEALALAMQNLSLAGGKRNRGCGEIICVMSEQKELVEQAIRKDAV